MNVNQIRINNFYITSEPYVMPTWNANLLRLDNKRLSERGKLSCCQLEQQTKSRYESA
jgi:hypothetical protein